ncbi:MAG TPA: hypothetical protein VGO60_01310 [Iamia sp.]|jgi:hypothetical protein|nr:hypothetical protein [Iamia sp.]
MAKFLLMFTNGTQDVIEGVGEYVTRGDWLDFKTRSDRTKSRIRASTLNRIDRMDE